MKALKELGQNFLTDTTIASQIAALGELCPGETVWEIGPGKGILTQALLHYGVKLTAYELDRRFEEPLRKRFGDSLELIRADILRLNWNEQLVNCPETIKLISNIPYQITSPLLSRLEEYSSRFELIALMVQKEVAERLTARVGTKEYGLMTIRLGLVFDINIALQVGRELFDPSPNVDSAVIVLKPRQVPPRLSHPELFYQLIHHAFMHRRKTLRNNLVRMLSKQDLAALDKHSKYDLSRRGESFSEAEFIDLCELLSAIMYRP